MFFMICFSGEVTENTSFRAPQQAKLPKKKERMYFFQQTGLKQGTCCFVCSFCMRLVIYTSIYHLTASLLLLLCQYLTASGACDQKGKWIAILQLLTSMNLAFLAPNQICCSDPIYLRRWCHWQHILRIRMVGWCGLCTHQTSSSSSTLFRHLFWHLWILIPTGSKRNEIIKVLCFNEIPLASCITPLYQRCFWTNTNSTSFGSL